MAIYHFHCGIGSRSKQGSQWNDAIKAAAYISGEKLFNERNGQTAYYQDKEIAYASPIVLLPDAVLKKHESWQSRSIFWNEVERKETAANAQLYRSFDLAIPRELPREDQLELAYRIADYFRQQGMAVDYAIHDEGKGNPHIHILTATRGFTEDGEWALKEQKVYALDKEGQRIPVIDPETGKQKVQIRIRKKADGTEYTSESLVWKRETVARNNWNSKESLEQWRKQWEEFANAALERAGLSERIDCRSYEDQGIDRIPQHHIGTKANKIREDQRKGRKVSFSHNGDDGSWILQALQKLRKTLQEMRPLFMNGGKRTKLSMKLDELIEDCKKAIKDALSLGITMDTDNDRIIIENKKIELINKQIAILEKQQKNENDEEKRREIYERLERLRSARKADDSAGRNADRDRRIKEQESGITESPATGETEEVKIHHRRH